MSEEAISGITVLLVAIAIFFGMYFMVKSINNQEANAYKYREIETMVEECPLLSSFVAEKMADKKITCGEYEEIYVERNRLDLSVIKNRMENSMENLTEK